MLHISSTNTKCIHNSNNIAYVSILSYCNKHQSNCYFHPIPTWFTHPVLTILHQKNERSFEILQTHVSIAALCTILTTLMYLCAVKRLTREPGERREVRYFKSLPSFSVAHGIVVKTDIQELIYINSKKLYKLTL